MSQSNVSSPNATASIDGGATAANVTVTATVTGSSSATANSGVGATDVGVAGAFALNIGNADGTARIGSSANVATNIPTGDVQVMSNTTATDSASADATASGFAGTGVGASVALNIGNNSAMAEAGGTVTSSNDVQVVANGDYTVNTNADGGAVADVAVAPAVAFSIDDSQTSAVILVGALISVSGDLLVRSFHRTRSDSRGRGAAAGADTAVGASAGVAIGIGGARSTVRGNTNVTGTATIESESDGVSQGEGVAGAMGAAPGTANVDTLLDDLVDFADDPQSRLAHYSGRHPFSADSGRNLGHRRCGRCECRPHGSGCRGRGIWRSDSWTRNYPSRAEFD